MERTSRYDTKISEALTIFEIKHEFHSEFQVFAVNRTSMVCAFPVRGDEGASYDQTLELLRSVVGSREEVHIAWEGRGDEYMCVGVYTRK